LIRIAYASENDVPRIVEIMQDAVSPIWTSDAFLSEMRKNDSLFLVALDDEIVGIETGSPRCTGFAVVRQVGDDGELLQIAVDSSARRCGIGDSLMAAILEYAADNVLPSVFLEVRSSNSAAIGLYEKHGFKPVRTRKDYYDDPTEDAVVMVWKSKDRSEL